MSTGTATPAQPFTAEPGEWLVRSNVQSGTASIEASQSGTQNFGGLLGRFSSYVLPLAAAAAAFGAPASTIRRTFSAAGISRSEIIEVAWYLDDFVYTEEIATLDQVQALNALLALPAVEGYQVELPD
jgi:hypothetical protein